MEDTRLGQVRKHRRFAETNGNINLYSGYIFSVDNPFWSHNIRKNVYMLVLNFLFIDS